MDFSSMNPMNWFSNSTPAQGGAITPNTSGYAPGSGTDGSGMAARQMAPLDTPDVNYNQGNLSKQPQAPANVMGMTPDQFSSMAGGMGAALAPKGSWQEKMGTFARGLGVAQMAAVAAQHKAKADQAQLKEMFDKGLLNSAEYLKAVGQTKGIGTNPTNPAPGV
jgi:hypothetical protein